MTTTSDPFADVRASVARLRAQSAQLDADVAALEAEEFKADTRVAEREGSAVAQRQRAQRGVNEELHRTKAEADQLRGVVQAIEDRLRAAEEKR